MLVLVSSRYIKFTITLQYLVCSPKSPHVPGPGQKNIITPLVQCTSHMCPIKIQWHLKLNYKHYWRVTITITNLNYHMNYTHWNLVVQHPNFDNLTQVVGSKYKALTSLSTTSKSPISLWLILHASFIYYCIFFITGMKEKGLILIILKLFGHHRWYCHAVGNQALQRRADASRSLW